MPNLLLINLPSTASEREIREWIESRDVRVKTLRIVRHQLTGTDLAYGHVELKGGEIQDAISRLDGKKMRNQFVIAKEVPDSP